MATIQKRRNTYRVQIRRKGHPAQTKSFSSKVDAKRWPSVTEGRINSEGIQRQAQPVLQPSSLTTLSEALKRYLRETTPTKRGAKLERNRIRAWQPPACRGLAGPGSLVILPRPTERGQPRGRSHVTRHL